MALKSKIEQNIADQWEKESIYKYDFKKNNTFVIDTPPPTISGSLHIGHVFSYAQTDILARFQRMQGKNVFYPMGWDNNGLPTEKRAQNLYGIACDPYLSTDDGLSLEDILKRKDIKHKKSFLPVSRKRFIDICSHQTKADQQQYEQLWRKLALSVDWSQTYETISVHAQLTSQKSFLDLYEKGFVENRYTPVFWDTQFKTAVAQADIEDRKKTGYFYDIKFSILNSPKENVFISTTRPELLPACIALAAHPTDERYKKFFNQKACSPLFSAPVPILPSMHAKPEKGTGILMICTFGDIEDVRFWETHKLLLKQIISPEGLLKKDIVFKKNEQKFLNTKYEFFSLEPEKARKWYEHIKDLRVASARKKIYEILKDTGNLVEEPKRTEQFVKFYEKGEYPLELIPARQWYITILKYKEELLQEGEKVKWHPSSMFKRYESWVAGLNQDWCISRQRFFGVPFPVWYPLDQNKNPDYNTPVLPYSYFRSNCMDKAVDPISSAPVDWDKSSPYLESMRGKKFIPDTAVMDTWATSSLTPQINSHWIKNINRHEKLFPADLRPQAHEIIRTWAFYTIAKCFFHSNTSSQKKLPPWKHIAVSGWVMNADRLKLSKSKKGKNFILPPEQIIENYSADAVRYWAGKAKLGADTIYDENMFKRGRKLALKIKNSFHFLQIQKQNQQAFIKKFKEVSPDKKLDQIFLLENKIDCITVDIDFAWVNYLIKSYQKAGQLLKQFHYTRSLEAIEESFWLFCDNYLELVKSRAYQFSHFEKNLNDSCFEDNSFIKIQNASSAVFTLDLSNYIFIKGFAPFMPYITEHIWSQMTHSRWSDTDSDSVHRSLWNLPSSYLESLKGCQMQTKNGFSLDNLLLFSFELLKHIRSLKAKEGKSLSTKIKTMKMTLNSKQAQLFEYSREDIERAVQVDSKNIQIEKIDNLSDDSWKVVLELE